MLCRSCKKSRNMRYACRLVSQVEKKKASSLVELLLRPPWLKTASCLGKQALFPSLAL